MNFLNLYLDLSVKNESQEIIEKVRQQLVLERTQRREREKDIKKIYKYRLVWKLPRDYKKCPDCGFMFDVTDMRQASCSLECKNERKCIRRGCDNPLYFKQKHYCSPACEQAARRVRVKETQSTRKPIFQKVSKETNPLVNKANPECVYCRKQKPEEIIHLECCSEKCANTLFHQRRNALPNSLYCINDDCKKPLFGRTLTFCSETCKNIVQYGWNKDGTIPEKAQSTEVQ